MQSSSLTDKGYIPIHTRPERLCNAFASHDGTFISFTGWMLGSERWFQDVSSMNLDCRHIPKLF